MSLGAIWTAAILAGAFLQALSLIPTLHRPPFRSWLRPGLIAVGGGVVLIAVYHQHDHLTLVSQLAAWVWLWRGVIRSRA